MDVLLPWLIVVASATALATLGGASAGAIAYLSKREQTNHRVRSLAWLAQHWHLSSRDDHLAGHIDGHAATISMRTLTNREGAPQRAFVLEVHGLPRDIAVRGDGVRLDGQPRTGDAYLDHKWAIAALDGAVGRLHHSARHELERIRRLADHIALEGGVLQVRCQRAEQLVQIREAILLILSSLGTGALVAELERRVADDPLPTVRSTMLWHLAQLDRARATRLAARIAAHAPEEKLITGILLDDRQRLLDAVDHPDGHLRVARRAGQHFLKTGGPADQLFRRMQARHGMEGLLATMDLTRGVEGVEASVLAFLPAVVQSMSSHPSTARPVLVAFARRLGSWGTIQSESALLPLLQLDDEGVRLAVLGALAHCGTVRAVPALHQVIESVGAFSSVRRAGQRTLDTIKARAPGRIGGLTLAQEPEERGRLSEAKRAGQAGALAVARAKQS